MSIQTLSDLPRSGCYLALLSSCLLFLASFLHLSFLLCFLLRCVLSLLPPPLSFNLLSTIHTSQLFSSFVIFFLCFPCNTARCCVCDIIKKRLPSPPPCFTTSAHLLLSAYLCSLLYIFFLFQENLSTPPSLPCPISSSPSCSSLLAPPTLLPPSSVSLPSASLTFCCHSPTAWSSTIVCPRFLLGGALTVSRGGVNITTPPKMFYFYF